MGRVVFIFSMSGEEEVWGRVGKTEALGVHAPWVEPHRLPPHSATPKQNASLVDAASW